MRRLPVRAVLGVLLAAPAAAQNVLFAEDFDAGIPGTWSQLHLSSILDPWYPGTSPATSSPDVFHEYFCAHGFFFRDNVLLSPPIDLRGYSRVDFDCVQHQLFPLQRVYNKVEVTTNGGGSYTVIHDERGTFSGPGTIHASMDAFAGMANVQVAFHYKGTVANEWRIDDVRITSPQPRLSIDNLAGGATATFTVAEAGAGDLVVFGLSLGGSGPFPTPFGVVQLTPPVHVLTIRFADPAGSAAYNLPIPASVTGASVFFQAADLRPDNSVVFSNWLARTVQ